MHKQIRLFSFFLQDIGYLNLFCSLLDFWWYFAWLMCCVKNISLRSCLEDLLSIDIRYVDKFILTSLFILIPLKQIIMQWFFNLLSQLSSLRPWYSAKLFSNLSLLKMLLVIRWMHFLLSFCASVLF